MRAQFGLDRFGLGFEIGVGEVQYGVTLDCQFQGDAPRVVVDGGIAEDLLEEGGLDVGDAGQEVLHEKAC